ncbi:MAG TPA: DUF2231 domain-containing protein [Vitreimonas sp.]|uniref:DUF2231 domain-containing protein n=1 Tax=Vitreimonas sp. TaxID=3069702 RepID=UPI002D71CA72|nr:DUF2231 domain-containing protein [Vitreimonas sp.]HYD89455.1 DUF2231 domain-containing protein [Vitreimonas sp.]
MARFAFWLRRFAALAAVLAIVAFAPVAAYAHAHERHPPEQQQTETPPAAHGDEPVMTMPWPTAPVATEHDERPTTFSGRLLRWLGGWHPAAVHFPIALLLTVAFLELMATLRRKPIYTASNKLLLGIAVIGAFVAAPLGWINAGLPAADDAGALVLHRWIGTALPFLMLFVWWLKPNAEAAAAGRNGPLYAIALSVVAAAILAQAYLGAEVTHGAGHMAF